MSDTDIIFPQADWTTADPQSQGVDPRALDDAIDWLGRITGPQGVRQVMVIRRGRLIHGGADLDTVHNIWSCTKGFLAIVLGLMLDDGLLKLDDPLSRYAAELEEFYPTATVRQFASFTSGYNHATGDTGKIGDAFTPAAPLHAPGAAFHYNSAPDKLAEVLARVAGRPLRDIFRERVARPIGIPDDQWGWDDWGERHGLAICGGSGMYNRGMRISARQMARVGLMMMAGGRWGERRIISTEAVGEMTRVQVSAATPPYDGGQWYLRLPGSYGLHLWLNGVTAAGNRMWPAGPEDLAAIQGNMNNICFFSPSWQLVVVRMGIDARIANDLYDGFFVRLRRGMLPV